MTRTAQPRRTWIHANGPDPKRGPGRDVLDDQASVDSGAASTAAVGAAVTGICRAVVPA